MMMLVEFLRSEVAKNLPYVKEHTEDVQSPFWGSRLVLGGPRSVQNKGLFQKEAIINTPADSLCRHLQPP